MRIDSHQHFWNFNTEEYGWIDDKMALLRRDHLPEELKKILSQNGYDGCIAVQARQNLEETGWLLSLADQYDFIRGVVGWVDLCSPEVEKQLQEFTKNPKLKGVRHVVHDEQDDNFMLRPDFLRGLSLLEKYNLTYDLLLFPKHLPVATEVVKQFPNLKFVLDHIAKPFIKDRKITPWKEEIENLASLPNVMCKVSGMVTEADWHNWKKEDFAPYLQVVKDAFGPDRLMVGSDWPVCTVAGSYKEVMGIPENYFAECSHSDLHKILGGNCKSFYGI